MSSKTRLGGDISSANVDFARFWDRPPDQVAVELIGFDFCLDGVGGIVVETEAYAVDDPASHSFVGETRRNGMTTRPPAIRPRDRDTIISALRAGVVPRLGLQHIQVGRQREIEAMIRDIRRVGEGGASIRFIIGAYGAGKTFFLFLVRQIALQSKLAVCQADLSPDRRIHASNGQARSLYAELARSLSTRTAPDGGALRNILESYIQKATESATSKGVPVENAIKDSLGDIREMVGGYEFATVIAAYARGYEEGNGTLQDSALRWLRGECTTKNRASHLARYR